MDISGVYNYSRPFELELTIPGDGTPTGVIFYIRSASSDEVKAIVRKHANERIRFQQRGKPVTGESEIARKLEETASFVADWDWGKNDYAGEKLEFNLKNVKRVLEEQDWIFTQVFEAANDLANFTETAQTSSAQR